VAAVGLLTVSADQFSAWIINNSTDGTSFNDNITGMLALSATSPIGSIMIILLGLIAILASVLQIVLMIVRGGLLVVLTGIFPTAAAFTNTEAGKGWFQKCTAWLIAFILTIRRRQLSTQQRSGAMATHIDAQKIENELQQRLSNRMDSVRLLVRSRTEGCRRTRRPGRSGRRRCTPLPGRTCGRLDRRRTPLRRPQRT
jgi:hypothetical protein